MISQVDYTPYQRNLQTISHTFVEKLWIKCEKSTCQSFDMCYNKIMEKTLQRRMVAETLGISESGLNNYFARFTPQVQAESQMTLGYTITNNQVVKKKETIYA